MFLESTRCCGRKTVLKKKIRRELDSHIQTLEKSIKKNSPPPYQTNRHLKLYKSKRCPLTEGKCFIHYTKHCFVRPWYKVIIIPHASMKLKGGYTGLTLSVRLSVHLWTESCPLFIFNNTRWIHLIIINLIKQLQNVCRLTILKFEFLTNFTNCIFVLFWFGIQYGSIVWVVMGPWGIIRMQAF